jgi:hypothetical protein
MENKARCIEVRTVDGRPFLKLHVYDGEVALKEERKETSGEQGAKQQNDLPLMSIAQKRYLFRILADKGLEEDKAHDHLKGLFQVDSLKEVTKVEASGMIERLLEENRKGVKDDRPPF